MLKGLGKIIDLKILLISVLIVIIMIVISLLIHTHANDQNIPKWTGYVSDFAGVLDKSSISDMTRTITSVKDTVEIAVVTVPELQGYDVADFTHKLATTWGVGKKGKDNGIVILIAVKERKVRIEVGYGMEATIPDSIAKRIIEQDMKPYLKKNDFGKGLKAGVDAIIKRIREKRM
jgi:uncharacterized protein